MLTDEDLLRGQYRHAIRLVLRCDIVMDQDRTGPGWPATISSPPDTLFPRLGHHRAQHGYLGSGISFVGCYSLFIPVQNAICSAACG